MVERPRNPPTTFYDATRPAHKSNLAACAIADRDARALGCKTDKTKTYK
jgi:hypothetical protein